MLYTKRETPEVMKKIRDYLEKHPNGKTAEKANAIIQFYMDYPQEFHDLAVFVKGRPPMNEWHVGSDSVFLLVTTFFTGTIEMTENDWLALNSIRAKNFDVTFRFPVRTKTQKQFIDYIYEVYCT